MHLAHIHTVTSEQQPHSCFISDIYRDLRLRILLMYLPLRIVKKNTQTATFIMAGCSQFSAAENVNQLVMACQVAPVWLTDASKVC